jgi:hypothetical protein
MIPETSTLFSFDVFNGINANAKKAKMIISKI